jgi:hypothetical protein
VNCSVVAGVAGVVDDDTVVVVVLLGEVGLFPHAETKSAHASAHRTLVRIVVIARDGAARVLPASQDRDSMVSKYHAPCRLQASIGVQE